MKNLNFEPQGDLIIGYKKEVEKKTKTGIILQNKEDDNPNMMTIVALGPDTPNTFEVGQTIIVDKLDIFKFEGEKYYKLRENNIIAVVDDYEG